MCIFFFNDTATTEIYTLSLHDALPIWLLALEGEPAARLVELVGREPEVEEHRGGPLDAGADGERAEVAEAAVTEHHPRPEAREPLRRAREGLGIAVDAEQAGVAGRRLAEPR